MSCLECAVVLPGSEEQLSSGGADRVEKSLPECINSLCICVSIQFAFSSRSLARSLTHFIARWSDPTSLCRHALATNVEAVIATHQECHNSYGSHGSNDQRIEVSRTNDRSLAPQRRLNTFNATATSVIAQEQQLVYHCGTTRLVSSENHVTSL